ncbi:Nuclear pore complex protein NUP98B [Hibiscus syriacus]|uniref:Nucleoporin autopeptidase n=1 Tax=Hibiscus syriacus TaxID=106335 RepID=A0A6A3A7F1_HIBSY|nr:nuclear pore complex protein NUP98A-like [Hibiscus syriacus]KAE8699843.1 Nuclear pore complex protein NUP98B [Hibiscus syriacus]
MFGSTSPFGQSSSSPFASQSVFGQTNNTNSNPFAPNPSFGSVTPFGSQTAGSIFGGTSTGVFGAAQSSSPFSSTTAFGASSSSVFGSSMPAFGSSSTPAFGSSSSSFGASSVFGQKPMFGFGSTTTQSSPFGSTTQQSQPAFGSSIFGSSVPFGSTQSAFGATSTPAFGATSTPAFGATSTPAFGTTSTPAFGATSTPAFGATSTPAFGATSTPAFGATRTPAFGVSNAPVFGTGGTFGASSTPAFGTSSTPAFGASSTPSFSFGSAFGQSTPAFGSFGATSTPAFGSSSTPAFGSSSTPAFGSTSTPSFGATSTPAFGSTGSPSFGRSGTAFGTPNTSVFGTGGTFGAPSTPAFGASSTPSFSFGSSPAFGQSTPAFGSSPFGTTAFGAQSSPFGSQSSAPAFGSTSFGQSTFGGQRGGSRVAPYTPTTEADGGSGTQPDGKLESISVMPVYKDKSHEELRWEDYQSGDKGGPNPAAGIGFGVSTTPSNPFGSSSTFGQTSANPFSSTSTNPFSLKSPSFNSTGFTTLATTSNPFQSTSSSLFGPTSSMTTSIFGSSSTPTFGTGSSLFGSSPSFSTSPSIFGTGVATATASTFATGLNFGGSQTSPLFSSTPAIGQTGNNFGQATSTFGQNTTNFGQTSIFNIPSNAFSGNMFSSYPSLASSSSPAPFGQTTPSFSSPFQPAQTSGAFSFSNFGQTQSGGGSSIFGQSNIGLSAATQSAAVAQPSTITNPYGTLPAMPQMSIGRTGAAPSVQYGISSMPVVDKPAPIRISSLLTSRYLSQRRIRLPARKYRTDKDSPKVPFFSDDEETPSVPKADAIIFPRENPRSLVIRPIANWPSRASAEKGSPLKDASSPVHENGKISDDGSKAEDKDENPAENDHVKHPVKGNQKANVVQDDHSAEKEDSYKRIGGHRAGEAAIAYEHGDDIEALMPKLRRSDYFTEPRIQELAAKERAEPGYCRRVKDFVVGRHGYGSIKFLGETDVRRLDLESLVQFNNREVIVYLDDCKKPPVGQGLNKPAEVTLLNIKCFDKKTSEQYTEGIRVERYKNMLKRKAEEQGAEFLSFDPIKGEWKFKVNHFSSYKLEDDDKDHL